MICSEDIETVLDALRGLCGSEGNWTGSSLGARLERETRLPQATVTYAMKVLQNLGVLSRPMSSGRPSPIRYGGSLGNQARCWELLLPGAKVRYIQDDPDKAGYFVLATPDGTSPAR
jgi:hypothetical protein